VYQWVEIAEEGGLIAYGPRIKQMFRDVARRQLIKLFRGVKPTDLPVELPTQFDLVINLQTAKAMGHEVPGGLMARADDVIS
jgi:putative tryptophan/tyrosine transport system substrate-binding protein